MCVHIIYCVHMDEVYTLREFRAKTKEAFDKADSQTDVIIERKGIRYVLIHESYYSELLKPEPAEKKIVKQASGEKAYEGCKHGMNPVFCRHAKNGKACK